MWPASFVQLFLFHFQPIIAISRHLQTADNESCEIVKKQMRVRRCLQSQYKRSRGERSGFAFTLGHFICLALPPLTAMSPPPHSTSYPSVFNVEYIYAICQSGSTSVPHSLHFPYMVNRENFDWATNIHASSFYVQTVSRKRMSVREVQCVLAVWYHLRINTRVHGPSLP